MGCHPARNIPNYRTVISNMTPKALCMWESEILSREYQRARQDFASLYIGYHDSSKVVMFEGKVD